MVDEEDGVIHDDPTQHDAADEGLYVEGRPGREEHQHHADHRQRHGEHHDERVTQRLVEPGHHHVDEDEGEHEAHDDFSEDLLLLLVFAAHEYLEVASSGDLPQLFADVGDDRAHIATGVVRVDRNDALLVLPLDADRPLAGLDVDDVPEDDRLPGCVRDRQVQDVPEVEPFGVLHLDEDAVLAPPVAEVPRRRAREGGLEGVRDLGDREPHVRGTPAVDAHEFLGSPGLAADARVGDAVDRLNGVAHALGEGRGGLQVVAAYFDLDTVGPHASREHAHEEEAARARPDLRARDPRELAPEVVRDLLARARALREGHQR